MSILNDSLVDVKKQALKNAVLTFIYHETQASILKLSQHTSVSVPSLTSIMQELLESRWVTELGIDTDAKSGRKPKLYGLRKNTNYILLFEIDLYHVRIVLFNFCNEMIAEVNKEINLKEGVKVLDILLNEADKLIERKKIQEKQIRGIGISIPGLVNTFDKIPYSYLNFPETSLYERISEKFRVPTYITNDLKAMALGEYRFGKAKGLDNAIIVNIDEGVGIGMILNGKVFQGTSGFSGEFGHIPVKNDGELCYCGKRGCLETVASARIIIQKAKQTISGGYGVLKTIVQGNQGLVTIDAVLKAAEMGDEQIIDILGMAATELGRGLATAVHLLNPQRIIINGSIAKSGSFILNPIEHALNKYCIAKIRNDVHVELSTLGNEAKIMGLQAMVAQCVLERTHN